MLKFNSCPPIIILMDVLFIFLFSTLLEKPPKIEIIPPKEYFKGGEIVVFNDKYKQYYWYNRNIDSWRNLSEMASEYEGRNLYYTIKCNELCAAIPKAPIEGQIEIAIIGMLYEQISGLTFIACVTDAYQCGNIRFTITSEGQVDKQKLMNDNPIFHNIRGIENLFGKQ